MTTDIQLYREDTGTHAAVRIVDGHAAVSAPYSRAEGILDRWVADARHTADEFTAWLEGETARAKAEMRALCDELDLPIVWAEHPVTVLFDKDNPHDRIGLGVGPALRARYGTVGGRSPFDTSPAADENMPGRVARLTPRDNPLAQAYANANLAREQGWTPDPADYGPLVALTPSIEGTYTRPMPPDAGPRSGFWRRVDGWLERADGWLRRKQADSDKRMGAAE